MHHYTLVYISSHLALILLQTLNIYTQETILALLLGATKGSDAFKALPLMSNKLMSEKKYKKSNKKGDKVSNTTLCYMNLSSHNIL